TFGNDLLPPPSCKHGGRRIADANAVVRQLAARIELLVFFERQHEPMPVAPVADRVKRGILSRRATRTRRQNSSGSTSSDQRARRERRADSSSRQARRKRRRRGRGSDWARRSARAR